LALCAGYGGLEIGIERVFPEYRTVCYVEGEAFAASHLVKKMEEGRMDNAPIWSNVRTFDGKPWSGKVDIISGGFPCQPYSGAGKQMGKEDPRDLWVDFVRIIGEVRPGFLFLENVPNIVKWRLNEIVLDLDLLGYHAAWCVVAASDVGAPHRRKRWFLFAVLDTERDGFGKSGAEENSLGINKRREVEAGQSKAFSTVDPDTYDSSKLPSGGTILKENRFDIGRICQAIPYTNSQRGNKSRILFKGSNGKFINSDGEPGAIISHTGGKRNKRIRGKHGEAYQTWKRKRNFDKNNFYGRQFEEIWKVEPGMGRLVDGAADWVDRIRILGNGVVPQQAAYALQILGERLAWGIVENRTPKL
jgi:DNA (cytosine-5)-methyltransferase 1